LNRYIKVQDGLGCRMDYRLKRYIQVQDGLQVEEIYESSGWITGLIDI